MKHGPIVLVWTVVFLLTAMGTWVYSQSHPLPFTMPWRPVANQVKLLQISDQRIEFEWILGFRYYLEGTYPNRLSVFSLEADQCFNALRQSQQVERLRQDLLSVKPLTGFPVWSSH